MIHVHQLDGCAPVPLAHYLKAFGILRLVSEQKDSDARGWWDGDRFLLATTLTRTELEKFFLNDYKPTPFVSPWNKGAGFFSGNQCVVSKIEGSKSPRFEPFRVGISEGRSSSADLSKSDKKSRDIKAEAKVPGTGRAERERIKNSEDYKQRLAKANKEFGQIKADLIPGLKLKWRGAHREWLDVAVVLTDKREPKFPALLGTGGNDGALDFTNNFMQRIMELFDPDSEGGGPRETTPSLVAGALWGVPVPDHLGGRPVGQFLPGMAGGANNSNGPDAESVVNPADFVLALEGTIAFRSHVARKFGSLESSRAAAPFVVDACGAAYSSASANDESARGEQWMPLWSRPATYTELRQLLAEGRAQIGVKTAREPLDFARAVKRLGTARGVGFQRYGYIERNGQSNLAVPLVRFEAAHQQSEGLACIDDLDLWLRRLRREARSRNAPAHLVAIEKRLVDALFALTERHDSPERWQNVLLRLAEIEEAMTHGSGFSAQPAPLLRPEWAAYSDDGTVEFRLALSFALQASDFYSKNGAPINPIRRHWLPLDAERPWRFATTGTDAGMRLDVRPEVVMRGRRAVDDAIALVERRLVEASQNGGRYLMLAAAPRAAASIADLTTLLSGGVDLERTLTLARALMAMDRKAWAEQYIPIEAPRILDWPDDAWLAIRLCTLPWSFKLPSGFKLDVGTDPALIRRLASGDAASAIALALSRLRAVGVQCVVREGAAAPSTAQLWAAALAFPITQKTARRFLLRLDPNKESL